MVFSNPKYKASLIKAWPIDTSNKFSVFALKYAKFSNPDTFMVGGGYTTSSPTINSIIKNEGLYSFEILRIDTNLDGLSAYDYETLFLVCNNCAESTDWYNKHNNNLGISFGTKNYTESMLAKYNVEHNSQTKEFKKQYKQTCLDKFGVDNPMKSLVTQNKSKQTCLEKYGVEYSLQSPIIQQKRKQTCLENSGYDNPFNNPLVRKQIIVTRRNNLLKKFKCESESEIIEKIFYFEKLYNIKKYKNNPNPNLTVILTYFPETAHKSITVLYKIFKASEFYNPK